MPISCEIGTTVTIPQKAKIGNTTTVRIGISKIMSINRIMFVIIEYSREKQT